MTGSRWNEVSRLIRRSAETIRDEGLQTALRRARRYLTRGSGNGSAVADMVERSLRGLRRLPLADGSQRWHQLDLGPVSDSLREFIEAEPHCRLATLEMLREDALRLAPGARVIDVGAGEAPYRELFNHVEYVTVDWSGSIHEGARDADVIASAENLPLPDQSFDAAIMTEVLEHLADPTAAVREVARVLRPGGSLFLTIPFVWPLHEMPHDYYRFTPSALRRHLGEGGFEILELVGRGDDYFTTLAEMMRVSGLMIGRAADGMDPQREEAADVLLRVSRLVESFAPLDALRLWPLGFNVRARRSS